MNDCGVSGVKSNGQKVILPLFISHHHIKGLTVDEIMHKANYYKEEVDTVEVL